MAITTFSYPILQTYMINTPFSFKLKKLPLRPGFHGKVLGGDERGFHVWVLAMTKNGGKKMLPVKRIVLNLKM